MLRIILSSAACLTVRYFSTLTRKWQDFGENIIEHKMCVFIFSTTFVWNTFNSKRNSERYYHKCTRYFSTLSHKWQDFRKNVIEHKICVL